MPSCLGLDIFSLLAALACLLQLCNAAAFVPPEYQSGLPYGIQGGSFFLSTFRDLIQFKNSSVFMIAPIISGEIQYQQLYQNDKLKFYNYYSAYYGNVICSGLFFNRDLKIISIFDFDGLLSSFAYEMSLPPHIEKCEQCTFKVLCTDIDVKKNTPTRVVHQAVAFFEKIDSICTSKENVNLTWDSMLTFYDIPLYSNSNFQLSDVDVNIYKGLNLVDTWDTPRNIGDEKKIGIQIPIDAVPCVNCQMVLSYIQASSVSKEAVTKCYNVDISLPKCESGKSLQSVNIYAGEALYLPPSKTESRSGSYRCVGYLADEKNELVTSFETDDCSVEKYLVNARIDKSLPLCSECTILFSATSLKKLESGMPKTNCYKVDIKNAPFCLKIAPSSFQIGKPSNEIGKLPKIINSIPLSTLLMSNARSFFCSFIWISKSGSMTSWYEDDCVGKDGVVSTNEMPSFLAEQSVKGKHSITCIVRFYQNQEFVEHVLCITFKI